MNRVLIMHDNIHNHVIMNIIVNPMFAPTGDGQLLIVSMVSGHQQQEAEHRQQHQYHQHPCHLSHPLIPDVFLASFICLFVC